MSIHNDPSPSQEVAAGSSFPWHEVLHGVRDVVPLLIGTTPFGVLFGLLGFGSGLSPWAVLASSGLVFAGSAQFVAAKLVADGVGLAVILLTTFVINARHALYGASLAPFVRGLPQRWMVPLAFLLTDEAYAVVIRRYAEEGGHRPTHVYHLGAAAAMWVNWLAWTALGLVAGPRLEGLADWGLDFAMVVTFIGITVPLIRNRPKVVAALVAGGAALLARQLPHNMGLMVAALAGITAGYWTEGRMARATTSTVEPSEAEGDHR